MINNSDAIIDVMLQGEGIALIPTFIANNRLLSDRLIRVLADWRIENPLPMPLYVITLPGSLQLWKTRVWIDEFMAVLKAR